MVDVPNLLEPIIAWRTWDVVRTGNTVRLASKVVGGVLWPTDRYLEAVCRYGRSKKRSKKKTIPHGRMRLRHLCPQER
jgi:hypothetical protein